MTRKRRKSDHAQEGQGCASLSTTPPAPSGPRDTAITELVIQHTVEATTITDISEASVLDAYVPELYVNLHYCVSQAIRSKVVRLHSMEAQKD
ncbi:40S ribosomal protein S26 [Vulpes lagopus]